MSELRAVLEFVFTYLDDLLCITKASLDDYEEHLKVVCTRLGEVGMKVNAPKSKFFAKEKEYLGYVLTYDGIKAQPNKVQGVKDIYRFLGMVKYYRDLWARCSKMLAPLT